MGNSHDAHALALAIKLARPLRCVLLASMSRTATPLAPRADQRLVADEPQGKADQDRREDRQPWSVCRFPDGRSRHSENSLCRRPAADRGVAAATRYIDSVMRSVWRSTKNHGRCAS